MWKNINILWFNQNLIEAFERSNDYVKIIPENWPSDIEKMKVRQFEGRITATEVFETVRKDKWKMLIRVDLILMNGSHSIMSVRFIPPSAEKQNVTG